MRVHVLTSSWPRHDQDPGGAFVHASCRALVAAGMALRVHPLEPGIALDGGQVTPFGEALDDGEGGLPSRLRRRPWLAPRIAAALLQRMPSLAKADRVVCHWALPFPLLAQAHGVDASALRTWCHGSGLRQPGAGLWLGRPHAVALVAAHQRGALPRRFFSQMQLLPVPVADFEGVDLGRHPIPPKLIFVGRLVRQKGAHRLPAILDHLPGWRAVVVGAGPYEDLLRADDRVDCLGPLSKDEWPGRVGRGVAVCPALGPEGAPMVVDELRHLGLPLVVANQEGLVQRVRHQQDGLIVRGACPQDWAAAVERARAQAALLTLHSPLGLGRRGGWSAFVRWVARPN